MSGHRERGSAAPSHPPSERTLHLVRGRRSRYALLRWQSWHRRILESGRLRIWVLDPDEAIARLTSGKVAVFEPTDEKASTLRTSLARVVARNERSSVLHYAMKDGVAYVGLEPISGARGVRKKKD
jgi:hypothetical protein